MPKGPQGQKPLHEWSLRERLLLALICFLAAAGLGLSGWKDPYIQYYLHRFDPVETVVVIVLTVGAIIWVLRNAPRT